MADRSSGKATMMSKAEGRNFELTALRSAGGPTIKVGKYRVSCTATTHGTEAQWSLRGLSGISGLPPRVPANYAHPLTASDGTVLAWAVLNERDVPEPGDGSIALRALHIKFTPASGFSGDVVIGAAACSPTD